MQDLTNPRITSSSIIFLYAVGSIVLILATISIVWHLLTTEFPTHSDVFWTGIQGGVLGVMSLIFLALGLLFLYRMAVRLRKPQTS